MTAVVLQGDALEVLHTFPDGVMDAVCTDPPAGISFMSKGWDSDKGGRDVWIAWLRDIMQEALRVLKPGGHALVWALPRTSHWTATAVEDAGFEVRDVGVHLFGTGFPKSLNVSKAINAADGLKEEREVVSTYTVSGNAAYAEGGITYCRPEDSPGGTKDLAITRGASERSRQWDGWGTALKPASEHWILARKPLVGVAANVLEYGTGALNVDGCRIEGAFESGWSKSGSKASPNLAMSGANTEREPKPDSPLGRWPANVTLDEDAAAMLDEQSGEKTGAHRRNDAEYEEKRQVYGKGLVPVGAVARESGGASRFFYVAKPSTREREAGTEGLPRKGAAELTDREPDTDGLKSPRAGAGRTSAGRANHHPTVKSIALMRWLVRLITPPGGLVLDPFCGSGTTGCAAVLEGMHFIGVEQSPEYVEIARARIKYWTP